MTRNDNWPQLIAHYRTRHGLTQTQFADNLKVTQQTVSRWESGKQTPDPEAQRLLRSVIGLTALSTKAAWQQRVSMSSGMEMLLEKGWRYLAGSERLHAMAGVAPERLAGKTLSELPATRDYSGMIDRTAFFDGGVRVVKARAEFRTGTNTLEGEIDIWPVLTSGDEIVAHLVAQTNGSAEGNIDAIRIFDFKAVLIDGSVVDLENEPR